MNMLPKIQALLLNGLNMSVQRLMLSNESLKCLSVTPFLVYYAQHYFVWDFKIFLLGSSF